MKAPQLLPPRDLLEQVQGVESGLRRGRSARVAGVAIGAVQVVILAANSSWLEALVNFEWATVGDSLPLLIPLFVLALCVLAAGWTRFWLRESEQPFRYTYSIAPFEPVTPEEDQPLFVPLHADLRERLSQRIRRLSLLEEQGAPAGADPPVDGAEAVRPESHVHIAGYYALRRRPPEQRWLAEITAWVRVGGPERPARLAEPVVRFALPLSDDPAIEDPESVTPPKLKRQEYEWILERTYFSVATEVYRQITQDVGRKIELLPNRWFRASALFHEAYDYAHSNTLDAYDEARQLYAAALAVYDPHSAILPRSGLRRQLAKLRIGLRLWTSGLRRFASRWFPRAGRAEVLAARAQIGYANTLLDTWVLAPLSGLRAAATYEAIPIAARAVDRLERLAEDTPGRRETLFDARVTLAFAHASLDARDDGRKQIKQAAADEPLRVDRDARYLFVRALLEEHLFECIPLFQRAVELNPRFEAAQFQLAATLELLWRTRRDLEPNVATTITEQYDKVLKLNPGNIAAWAKIGYMLWLQDKLAEARPRFEGGRRFKEIKQEAYVAEIDHGLARIAAEEGRFEDADRHYIQAVSARLAQGWAVDSFAKYHFDRISMAILNRFRAYVKQVEGKYDDPDENELERTTKRVRDSVLSFVLYDFSEACFGYWRRTHDYTVLEEAYAACTRATRLNDRFVLALYLRYQLEEDRRQFVDVEPDGGLLDKVEELVPAWPEAAHALLQRHDARARQEWAAADAVRAEADGCDRLALEHERGIEEVLKPKFDEGVRLKAGVDEPVLLREKAIRLRHEAEAHEKEAKRREDRACGLARTLLPHKWLWGRENSLDWAAIGSPAAERELQWERSFEPYHVKALVAWCGSMAEKQDGVEVDRLLELIERRFLPNDMDLVELRFSRANGDGPAEEHRRHMRRIVRGWLAADTSTFVALRKLDPTKREDCEVFARVACMPDLSPYLYHWLGKQLLGYWQATGEPWAKDAARDAYAKVKRKIHPEALVELADELAELGDEDERRQREVLYREAAGRKEASLQLLEKVREHFASVGDHERVLAILERASRDDASGEAPARRPEEYAADKVPLLLRLGRFDDARAELEAIPAAGGALESSWRTNLARTLAADADPDADAASLARLRDWLGAQHRSALRTGATSVAQDAAAAALELAASGRHGLWPDTDDGGVSVPAIFVEADPAYFPQGQETPFVQTFIREGEQLRQRIRRETGVFIPTLRLLRRGSDLGERGYVVSIHGAPVVRDSVAPDAADPAAVILERADQAICSRLATFVNLQFVDIMLREHRKRARKILGDERRRCAFVSLLKRLVDDGVPIGDVGLLIEACENRSLRGSDLPGLAEEIRRSMVDRLPGRTGRPIRLPIDLEAQIGEFAAPEDRRPELAIPFDRLTELRERLRELRGEADDAVLVASSGELRRTVRRIVAIDLPATPVLTPDELSVRPQAQPPLERNVVARLAKTVKLR